MSINLTKLDEQLSVKGQTSIDDRYKIADFGYMSLICKRPGFEVRSDQSTSKQFEALALSLGIVSDYLPVEIGAVSTEHDEKYKKLLSTLSEPILAFCDLGKRATTLHSLVNQDASVEQRPMSNEWLIRSNKIH